MGEGQASTRFTRGMLVDGRFRLEQLVGKGGFGEVWRATQIVADAPVGTVALKLLRAPEDVGPVSGSEGSGSEGRHEWLNEVRAVRKVDCPAITKVYDVNITREPMLTAFIAMELLEGQTLAQRLADGGSLYWRRALEIGRTIAVALAACHRDGVFHCDLKPENVFLLDDGSVRVLDFGVAALGGEHRRTQLPPASEAAPLSSDMATDVPDLDEVRDVEVPADEGRLLGTPGYMAPESYQGIPTASADVYALGVTLYRMLTGELPQRVSDGVASRSGKGARESYKVSLHSATLRGDLVPLAQRNDAIPRALSRLVDALLATDPDKRPRDALAAIDEVRERPYGIPEPPYVGLEAFEGERAGFIAGRDGDIAQLVATLADRRAVFLSGPSGCGKSSLAIAGVAAAIDRELLDDTDGWRACVIRPSDGHDVLARSGGDEEKRREDGTGVVVIVDQFEEVMGLDDDERRRFCAAVADLVEGKAAMVVAGERCGRRDAVRLIATVRDDLLGAVAALPELRRIPEQNLYTVRGVEPNAIRDIVEGPAAAAGYALEHADEVVEEARGALESDASSLPLLQFALTRWWEERDRDAKRLTRAAWRALGGLEGALAQSAQALFDDLDGREREALKTLLVRMFRPDGTRVAIAEDGLSEAEERVLPAVLTRRLIRRRKRDDETATLEVVHEALARRWSRLEGWLEETREDRLVAEAVESDAAEWLDSRDAERLWKGRRLVAASDLERHGTQPLSNQAQRFLRASRAAQRRGRLFVGAIAALGAGAALTVGGYFISYNDLQQARDELAAQNDALENAVTVANGERARAEQARNDVLREKENVEQKARELAAAKEEAERQRAEAERQRVKAEEQEAEAERQKDLARKAEERMRRACGMGI